MLLSRTIECRQHGPSRMLCDSLGCYPNKANQFALCLCMSSEFTLLLSSRADTFDLLTVVFNPKRPSTEPSQIDAEVCGDLTLYEFTVI